MLEIVIPAAEYYDEEQNLFIETKHQKLQLEHSLVSLARWEAQWKKPFMSSEQKTIDETIDYIRCMTITQNVDPMVYKSIPKRTRDQITEYINAPMTATKFTDSQDKTQSNEVVTAELIYFWMIASGIPFECQKWHLNRLLTLIRVCNIKNNPPDKRRMGRQELMNRNHLLNEQRKAQLKTRG